MEPREVSTAGVVGGIVSIGGVDEGQVGVPQRVTVA